MRSLISLPYTDIDDTIKDSHVLKKLQLLKSTFTEPPHPVPGMSELYTSLYASLSTSLASTLFIYVSASPFQLYPYLHQFISPRFPAGPIFLRNLKTSSLKSLRNFVKGSTAQEHKLRMVRRIHEMYPDKRFLQSETPASWIPRPTPNCACLVYFFTCIPEAYICL